MRKVSLSMTGKQYRQLHAHLFPNDGFEAVAIGLCGRHLGEEDHRLLVRRIELVPYSACSVRKPDQVTWSTEILVPLLEEANKHGYSIVKFHGHTGFADFSQVDDVSDRSLFPSVDGWIDLDVPHASVILMRDGRVFGRSVTPSGEFCPLSCVSIIGDELKYWRSQSDNVQTARNLDFANRHMLAFGEGTISTLQKMSAAVVGCSGTGSPVVEQLARLGIGRLVLIDPDDVEEVNLNRIYNATRVDAHNRIPKVDVMARAIHSMDLGTQVSVYHRNLIDPMCVRAVAGCDVVFGCMDTLEGRFLLNKLATYYVVPYLDLGVRIEANGSTGTIDQICGSVHYVQPDGSSLLSRGLLSLEAIRAEGTRRRNPAAYEGLVREKYISGVPGAVTRPAVISLNSLIASLGVNELLARLHAYRDESNDEFAVQTISLSHGALYTEPEGEPCKLLSRLVGKGDVEPLLDDVELSE